MTTHDDDQPEPPIVTETCNEAAAIIKRMATLLQLAGWDAITISLTRAIEVAPGQWCAPGATATVTSPACEPILPVIASCLRKQADQIEAHAGGQEADGSYIQDQTHYASGCSEWPR
jgi:hypothetical protein